MGTGQAGEDSEIAIVELETGACSNLPGGGRAVVGMVQSGQILQLPDRQLVQVASVFLSDQSQVWPALISG